MSRESQNRYLQPPWKPGQSGNERGVNKHYQAMLRCARINSPDMLAIAVECARDIEAPWQVRLTAVGLVCDRAWGKAKEHLSVNANGIATLRIEFVDPRNADSSGGNHRGNGDARIIDSESFEISFPKQDDTA